MWRLFGHYLQCVHFVYISNIVFHQLNVISGDHFLVPNMLLYSIIIFRAVSMVCQKRPLPLVPSFEGSAKISTKKKIRRPTEINRIITIGWTWNMNIAGLSENWRTEPQIITVKLQCEKICECDYLQAWLNQVINIGKKAERPLFQNCCISPI